MIVHPLLILDHPVKPPLTISQNIEANAILYFVLQDAQSLAHELNHTSTTTEWNQIAARIKTAANSLLWDEQAALYRDNETTTLHPQGGNSWAIKANPTTSTNQSNAISQALQSRRGPYGAPAPEAGTTVSPFIGGFELQAHYLADQPEAALDLIQLQWGFMLQDPRMTQSSFIEGFSTDGTLHYAPYSNDARVSHAHGWSTGPTSALSMYAAGIQLTGPAGADWRIAPQPGNLSAIDAGLSTSRGQFAVQFQVKNGKYEIFSVQTPSSTWGDVVLPGAQGTLVSRTGQRVPLVNGVARGLSGGDLEAGEVSS